MLDKKMIAKEDIKFGFIAATFLSFFEIIILAVINSYSDEAFDSLSTIAGYELIAYAVLSLILSYAHYRARIKRAEQRKLGKN